MVCICLKRLVNRRKNHELFPGVFSAGRRAQIRAVPREALFHFFARPIVVECGQVLLSAEGLEDV
jgi:hypothetical protein